jgi:hypothetical protein
MLDQSSWYWTSVAAKDLSSSTLNYSFSGDRVYHKSTFRPQASIQAYYTKLNALTDLLSKREFLYRNYFSKVYNSYAIPQNLTASPANPLIEDFKTSFLFIDPAQYTSESTKSTSYQSVNYLTPMYLKETLNILQTTPVLGKLFKDFNFFFWKSNWPKHGAPKKPSSSNEKRCHEYAPIPRNCCYSTPRRSKTSDFSFFKRRDPFVIGAIRRG